MASQNPDLMRLLEAIEAVEPTRTIPMLEGLSVDRRNQLMGEATRNRWISISAFQGNETLRGEMLALRPDGRAALQAARDTQDDAVHDAGSVDALERRRRRSQYMNVLYEEVGDNTRRSVMSGDIGNRLAWDDSVTKPVVRYLASKRLVTYRTLGGGISITSEGIDEVERAISEPEVETENLASMNVTFGDVSGTVQLVQRGDATASRGVPPPPHSSFLARLLKSLRSWTGIVVLGVTSSLISAAIWQLQQDDDSERSRLVVVDNRVTNGASAMLEDTSELRLAREPTLDCLVRPNCALGEPRYSSGDRLQVVCRVQGSRVTNGVDGDSTDDGNPGLVDSTLWYGVRHGGEIVFASEVWIERQYRGGLGLPECR